MSNQAEKTVSSAKRAPASPAPAAERQSSVTVVRSVADQRQAMIAEAAYYLALQRKFEPGHEVEDWLLAESQIDRAVASGAPSGKRQ
jgi:Protein of unknown function (DUF2934)